MASRYLRASGDWNGPVWAATSGGAAGSASTPTADDDVSITAAFTVTLTDDAICKSFSITGGGLSLGSHKLTIADGVFSSVAGTRNIDLGSGTLEVNHSFGVNLFYLQGSGLTFNAGSSTIVLNVKDYAPHPASTFSTGGNIFNDVILNMGNNYAGVSRVNITGSPTFRSLMIQSKNSAAHTVTFDEGAAITTQKFVAIGSSAANKLTLNQDASGFVNFNISNSSYGQHLTLSRINTTTPTGSAPKYIGSNSETFSSTGWLLQDPPKISTLVDPLTTAPGSNTNWTVNGTVTQVTTGKDGGGYKLASGAKITSVDTYDLLNSSFIIEAADDGSTIDLVDTDTLSLYISSQWVFLATRDNPYVIEDGPNGAAKYVKLAVTSGGVFSVKYSNDGSSWVNGQLGDTYSLTADERALIRSMRIRITGSNSVIGSINVLPTPPKVYNGNFLPFFF